MQVDHIDGNKNNNTLKNLQYLTPQNQNMMEKFIIQWRH